MISQIGCRVAVGQKTRAGLALLYSETVIALTEREKVLHLLRRFGLGATPEELDAGLKLGPEGLLKSLIEYEATDPGLVVSPWEVCFEEGKDEVYLDAFRPVVTWGVRLAVTKRPLEEKLTLFWHDHFAVSANKVEFGPMMQNYVDTLRRGASGKFSDLLHSISKDPAMMMWLDTTANQKGHPNENFAREVMELFTLGIGHYTEKDVQESARALTGWGIRYLLYEQGGEKIQQTAKDSIQNNRPLVAFCTSPDLHDDGAKTILGQTKAWTGDELLDMLADRPETAHLIAHKLWSFFAYPDPEPAVVERLAAVYRQNQSQIKPMLYAIAQSPEFWSDKCVRRQVKSPLDFTVSIVRQLGVGAFLATLRSKEPRKWNDPLPKPFRDIGGLVITLMVQQGMFLLNPPSVAGWDWGQAWISSDSMIQRMKLGELLTGGDRGGAKAILGRLAAMGAPTSTEQLVDHILTVFDGQLPPDKKALFVQAADKAGGAAALGNVETAAPVIASVLKLLFASPEFQFC